MQGGVTVDSGQTGGGALGGERGSVGVVGVSWEVILVTRREVRGGRCRGV